MFNHSTPVPRIYRIAAKVYRQCKEGQGSLKQLVYNVRHTNLKGILAMVASTMKREAQITALIEKSGLLIEEPRFNPFLAAILIHELLFRDKPLQGDCTPIKTILAFEPKLRALSSDSIQPIEPVKFIQVQKPRYVRVNTLRWTPKEAIEKFEEEGRIFGQLVDNADYDGFLEKIPKLNWELFMSDFHIPSLLVFPPGMKFYNHPAYKNRSIILQDKASCLPVHLLAPPPGSVVLDMCAAPGMKTTQAAAAIRNKGTVYACEMDRKRFNTLQSIVTSSGATCVQCRNVDVLHCNAQNFPHVEYILVDPSCSGSGMTDRVESNTDDEIDKERLRKLAGFQIKILRSALTRYPEAKRVVYSTCSTCVEENEDVVRQVLETTTNFKLVSARQLLNNAWKNFGSDEFGDIGRFCLYAKPEQDFTNGFFVAVFERLKDGEENQFFNRRIYDNVQQEKKNKIDARNERKRAAAEANANLEQSSEDDSQDELENDTTQTDGKKKRKTDSEDDTEMPEANTTEAEPKGKKKKINIIENVVVRKSLELKKNIKKNNKRKSEGL